MIGPLASAQLPQGVRARFVSGINGLDIHYLEAGFGRPGRPLALLLHGFPELAFSWRKIMPALAAAGFHVIAPDQRGYGRTTGWDNAYDCDLSRFAMFNLARDAIGLIAACGHDHAACVIGHDFGAPLAAWCALLRPDLFRALVLMSAPFPGPPALSRSHGGGDIDAALAALARPRKHYQRYYSTATANTDMLRAPQGLAAFLRAYYHMKSADWPGNRPFPLRAFEAAELAQMPTYYIMDRAADMAATVARAVPDTRALAACAWLTEAELGIYAGEFARTGFQGGLNWYRAARGGVGRAEQEIFAGRSIEVPALFIAGASDWGVYQVPGNLERMARACAQFRGHHLIPGAGHWVQQEQPAAVLATLGDFLLRCG
jgi:pimeloyl-ACP methyl ester carboxylesterase